MEIEVVLNAGATIGESPTWSTKEKALYWIDVKKPALHRYDPSTGDQRSWILASDVGGFALIAGAPGAAIAGDVVTGAVVALREGVFRLEFASGTLTRLTPPPFDPSLHRFNEGACDALGRFWIGVMFDPLDAGKQPQQEASLHSFTLEGGLRAEPDAADLHNGMAWSPDGRLFYLAHSQRREIFAYTFDATSGRIGTRRLFARLPESLGLPDGAAVDTEGGYWCALHGASRLRRYLPDGTVDRDIMLPVTQPTMCGFGGDALDELYVTTASDKLDAEQRGREPLAGALLRLRPGKCGIPRHCTVR